MSVAVIHVHVHLKCYDLTAVKLSRVRIGIFLVKFQPLLVNLTILSPMRTDGNLPRLLTYPGKIVNLHVTCRIESR